VVQDRDRRAEWIADCVDALQRRDESRRLIEEREFAAVPDEVRGSVSGEIGDRTVGGELIEIAVVGREVARSTL